MANTNSAQSSPSLEGPALFERLRLALHEDLAPHGDVTSQALVPEGKNASAELLVKADGVLCGVKLLSLIFHMAEQFVSLQAAGRAWDLHDAEVEAKSGKGDWEKVLKLHENQALQTVQVTTLKKDGDRVTKGDVAAKLQGNARALLVGERLALNLLCRLSGIATQTAHFISKVSHTKAKILDTRKTTPLWRDLEKYAVKCGGGENHRRCLADMVLIKDNHLELWGSRDPAGAVNAARAKFPTLPIEVEVVDLAGLQHVLQNSAPNFALLDNFSAPQLSAAVTWCDEFFAQKKKDSARPLLEASGGITLETLTAIAETGVDRISVGALTHSVRALDMSLELKI
jgi:nicotinate-nucleotide pyrophosphorylase (carboxylating)